MLHTGKGGRVYLAEHMALQVKRIIKEVVKNSDYTECFYSEINALKRIRHENIPIIYDVFEGEDYYYIIEEYIDGISLFEFITNNGRVTEDKAIDFGIQLADLITFLHSKNPNPILFLDLQPKNIIINGEDKIYLIDFGSSIVNSVNERKTILGTPGYAAPEQYLGKDIGIEADIYGIGAILLFAVTGESINRGIVHIQSNQNISHKFKQIILKCLDCDKEYRFAGADKLLFQLKLLKNKKNEALSGEKPLIISVAGAERKVGTTHIALLICRFLCDLGFNVAYEENNSSNHIRSFAKAHNDCLFYDGVFRYKGINMIPKYNANVYLVYDYEIIVKDEGVYKTEELYGDYSYLISGSSEWEIEQIKESVADFNMFNTVIFNLCTENRLKEIIKLLGVTGQGMPFLATDNPLSDKDKFIFNNLLEEVLKVKNVYKNHKKVKTTMFNKWFRGK